ncbi:thiopeptide-type bacteriocin biosynthesis protein [Staphylococcus shinii]
MIRKPGLNFSEYFLLSNDDFENLSLKQQIKTLLEVSTFKKAICVASLDLYNSCLQLESKNLKDIKNIHSSIIKYYIRMCTRSTPFGFFSGCSIINAFNNSSNSESKNDLNPICSISEEWLEKFILEIIGKTNIIKKLSLKTNEAIFIKNDRIYVDFIPGKMKEVSVSISQSELNNFVLNYLTEKHTFSELFNILKTKYLNLNEFVLMDYLKNLIRRGFILTNLQLGNFKCLEIKNLYTLIGKEEIPYKYKNILRKLENVTKMKDLDLLDYKYCIEEANKVVPNVIPFKVNSIFESNISLESDIKRDIEKMAKVYYYINQYWNETSDFNKDFMEKYGINVAVNIKDLAHKNKHLGLKNSLTLKRENKLLVDLAFRFGNSKNEIIDLSDVIDLKKLEYTLPASFDLYFRIFEDEKGNKMYFPSGNIITVESHKTFGRFIKYFESVKKEIYKEKKYMLSKILEEIPVYGVSFKPIDFKGLNVMGSPILFKRNLFFNSYEKDYQLNNISVYCDENGEIKTFDNKYKRKLHLATNNMLNYEASASKICSFLLNNSENNYIKAYPINSEELEKFTYYPRISYGNIVLRLRKWKFKLESSTYNKIIESYNSGNIDRYISLEQLDNFILLDLEAKYTANLIKKEQNSMKDYIELVEANHLVLNKSRYKEFEFVFLINIRGKSNLNNCNNILIYKDVENRLLSINNGLIYLKIYYSYDFCDEVLKKIQIYLLQENIEDYFFIKYYKPCEHIRLRIFSSSKKIKNDLKIINYLSNLDIVENIEMAEYEREVERYGGITNIENAEKVFKSDSKIILQLLNIENKIQCAFTLGLAYLEIFCENFNREQVYNMLKVNVNKDDYSFYRKWIKCNKEFVSNKCNVENIFYNSMIVEDIKNYKQHLSELLLTSKYLNIVFSFIHMSYNRLGIDNETENYINKCIYLYLKEEYYKWQPS